MAMQSLLLLLLIALLHPLHAQQDSITTDDEDDNLLSLPFGLLDLQIRSRSPSTLNEFLFNILSETSTFLDIYLTQAFHKGVLYSHVTLAVDSYDLTTTPTIAVNASAATEDKVLSYASNYDATVSLSGMALFDTDGKKPWKLEVTNSVRRVLLAHANELERRLAATNNELLRDLKFVIVTLNGETMAGGNYTERFAGAQPRGSADSIASQDDDSLSLPAWSMAVMTGLGSFIIVLALIYVCRHIRRTMRRNRSGRRGAPTQKLTTDTDDYRDNDIDDDEDAEEASPMHSDIVSVASSAFTYNPSHLYGSGISRLTPTSAGRNAANANSHSATTSSNNAATTNPLLLFHNDISAISNKKDLSLIDEEQSEDASTASSSELGSPQNAAATRRRHNLNANADMPNALDLNGPSQNVIDDLKDLSAQIDTFRRSSKGGIGAGDFA
ncbi:hypothetical protein MPSEU_000981900 [Mayamaea pseudoterrestris]|nr:hypothetical protein MPSEU_000981900 [Mayamaea pseudoterrestris]